MHECINKLKNLDGTILIGVSGGVDSMVLTDVCIRAGKKPVLAHVNYQKRGTASDADEELVRNFAKKHGLLFLCKKVDQSSNGNFQNWARNVRYDWFHVCSRRTGTQWIATAHHIDDQLETLLFRLLRRASIGELGGIADINPPLIRPLLDISKVEILNYAKERSIPYRTDQSNFETTYDRNYIRHVLIPEMDEQNRDWRTRILDLPKLSTEFHEITDSLYDDLVLNRELDRVKYMNLPPLFQKAIIHKWIHHCTDASPSRSLLNASGSLEALQTGHNWMIDESYSILRNRDKLVLISNKTEQKKITETINEVDLETDTLISAGHIELHTGKWSGKPEPGVLELDLLKLSFPIKIRNWQDGDRIRPLGMKGTQLISDLLTNRKVPSHIKNQSLVIQTFEQSVCAVIFPKEFSDKVGVISQNICCASSTTKTLIIRKSIQ